MISAVILTHNDEVRLERTLKSLMWCGEIVIVDDFSSDKTLEIAKKFTSKIYQRHLEGDFADQRNFGLEKAKGDWILFVDSDEVVPEGLQKEIIVKTQNNAMEQSCVGYLMKRKDYFGGRWLTYGETANVRLLRLAKKSAGHWTRPVHEVWDVRGSIGELVNPILHHPHANVAQFLDEINRYSTLNARYLFNQGIREPGWHILGKPLAKFFLNYLWRKGYRDGIPGAVVAIMMSFHSFLTRAKLWQLWDKK